MFVHWYLTCVHIISLITGDSFPRINIVRDSSNKREQCMAAMCGVVCLVVSANERQSNAFVHDFFFLLSFSFTAPSFLYQATSARQSTISGTAVTDAREVQDCWGRFNVLARHGVRVELAVSKDDTRARLSQIISPIRRLRFSLPSPNQRLQSPRRATSCSRAMAWWVLKYIISNPKWWCSG